MPLVHGATQAVHMGPTYVCLARMEIDDLILSFPLVGGASRRRILPGDHSDVAAKVRRAFFGCDRADVLPRSRVGVQSILPCAGRFDTCIQNQEARHLPGR